MEDQNLAGSPRACPDLAAPPPSPHTPMAASALRLAAAPRLVAASREQIGPRAADMEEDAAAAAVAAAPDSWETVDLDGDTSRMLLSSSSGAARRFSSSPELANDHQAATQLPVLHIEQFPQEDLEKPRERLSGFMEEQGQRLGTDTNERSMNKGTASSTLCQHQGISASFECYQPKLAAVNSSTRTELVESRTVVSDRSSNYLQGTGYVKDSNQQQQCTPQSAIVSLPEELLYEIFNRLPSLASVIRAACSCKTWNKAVALSPSFRSKFLDKGPTPLLGLLFDPPSMVTPAFPTFVPTRNLNLDLPAAVRWGDFFVTNIQMNEIVPPNWIVVDVRGGHMLLMNRDDLLLTVNPLLGQTEGYFDPHEAQILMDYQGTYPRVLKAHLVCDESDTGRFIVISFAHDQSRVRAAIFVSSSHRTFSLPWFDVGPRANELDEEDGWLDDGVQAGRAIYWVSRNREYVVILNMPDLRFSVSYLPDLRLDDIGSYCFGETARGKMVVAYIDGPRIIFKCSANQDGISGPWDVFHEANLQQFTFRFGELRIASVRNGIAYVMASRLYNEFGMSCWFASYNMSSQKLEIVCQHTAAEPFQPFNLPWPRSLCEDGSGIFSDHLDKYWQELHGPNSDQNISLHKELYSYQIELKDNPQNHLTWLKYIKVVEKHGDEGKIRDLYEKAVCILPTDQEKSFWNSFMNIWMSYAIYEEETASDINRARSIYNRWLEVIPHQNFTFSKVWVMAANFEIRQENVAKACQILRAGIARRPTAGVYEKLIGMEHALGHFDATRDLFESYMKWSPTNCNGWMQYAEMEHNLGEHERARAIYERAVQQPNLDLSTEILWKDYLIFEINVKEVERARAIYEKLIVMTKDVNGWASYARFESDNSDTGYDDLRMEHITKCRAVFKRALEYFSSDVEHEERNILIKQWAQHEQRFGHLGNIMLVEGISWKANKRKRVAAAEDGCSTEKKPKRVAEADIGGEHDEADLLNST